MSDGPELVCAVMCKSVAFAGHWLLLCPRTEACVALIGSENCSSVSAWLGTMCLLCVALHEAANARLQSPWVASPSSNAQK